MANIETKVLTARIPLPLVEEERSRRTREAMADVDARRVIDHQSVQAWADSLGTDNPLPAPVVR